MIQQTISAKWVVPVCSPPIADGIVTFANGLIEYVGAADGRRIDQRFDDATLLPGLINTHTHLDLTGAAGQTPPKEDFCAHWLESVIAYRQTRSPEQVQTDVAEGVRLCLAAGTTLVGDIALRAYDYGRLNSVAFQELIGLSGDRSEAAITTWRAAGFIPAGASPHAPYTFRFDKLGAIPDDVPLAMHLAETRDELELLDAHVGRLRQFLEKLGAWDPSGLAPRLDAILAKLGERRGPLLLVHCNYLPVDAPIPAGATVVYCPRTLAAFGHSTHPFRDFIARGVHVALGTDSLASNPDLSVLNEARFVKRQFPDFDNNILLQMITEWGAAALGQSNYCGSLNAGKRADLCVVAQAAKTADPIEELFHDNAPIRATYIAGSRVNVEPDE